jgi:hypothetical protein
LTARQALMASVKTEVIGVLRNMMAKWPPPVVALVSAASITGLLAVTAIASRQPLTGVGQALPPPGAGRSQISAPPWALVLAGAGVMVALLGIVVSVNWRLPRRRREENEPVVRRAIVIPRIAKLLALLAPVALGAVLFAAALAGSHSRTVIVPPRGKIAVPTGAPVPRQGSSFNAPGWIVPSVIGVVLGGAGAIVLVLALRGRFEARAEPVTEGERAEELGEVVTASLEDLRREPDPRRAVIAAYRRMETALAEVGLPRRACEAPREYSGRAHTHLELSGRPLRQLTALFERARFGHEAVAEPLREQAIASLSALREELSSMSRQQAPI